MKNILITILLLSLTLFSFSGKTFEGEVTYKISYKNLPEEMGMYKAMLPKKTKLTLKGEWSKMQQNMGIFAKTNVIHNSKTKKSIVLMNLLGKKFAVESVDTTKTSDHGSYSVKELKDIKVIAGYKCNKVIISDSSENNITIWITKKLPTYKNSSLPSVKLKGFPMEYHIEKDGMTLRVSATKVNKKNIKDKEFAIPKGYEKKTPEEMEKMMKGIKL